MSILFVDYCQICAEVFGKVAQMKVPEPKKSKNVNYAKLYTLRADGRYQASYIDGNSKRHFVYDKDPERLYSKMQSAGEPKELTFAETSDEWETEKSKNVEYKTAEGYAAPLKRLKAAFGDLLPGEITPSMMQSFVNDMAAKGYKRAAVQRPLDVARMIFDYCIVNHNLSINNPCNAVKLPRGLTQAVRELAEPEQIEKVKANVGLPFGLFAFMMMYTGMRDGELLAIKSDDIEGDYITISKSLSWQPNKPVIKSPKTTSGNRTVFILQPLRDALPEFDGYLFSSDGGKTPLTNTQFRKRWAAYCRDAGLSEPEYIRHKAKNGHVYTRTKWTPTIVPYQLRHEYATMCYDADLDIKDTQELMGHASMQTTQRIYTHIRQNRRESSIEKLNKYVSAVKDDVKSPESSAT